MTGRHRARPRTPAGRHRAGAHRTPGSSLAPRVVVSAVAVAVAGLAVTTTVPWQPSDAQAASGDAMSPAGVAVAGFVPEPRVQAGSRGAARQALAPMTAVSAVTLVGRSLARELPHAYSGVDRSMAAGMETSAAGTGVIAATALQEAHHPPVLEASRTSSFGMRWGRLHRGIDYGADIGTPLYAVTSGTITAAGWTPGLGYHVKLTTGDGTVLVYGHLSRITVSKGQLVVPGQRVGDVGSSGTSTGAHLHFEVRVDGESIDPDPWLQHRLGERHLPPRG